MGSTNVKEETMKMMEKKTAIEAEMNSIIQRLCQPSGPGLSGNLVDSEGFPRSDIDIPVVRADRHRLAELRNDHKDISDKITANIQILLSSRLAPNSSSAKQAANVVVQDARSSMDMDTVGSIPFAVVDEIADASPTAEDGLQLGDQIVKFGSIEYQFGESMLQKLASETQANQGRPILVIVMRQGASINLTVTPRAWQGRGLLGCSFRML